ncbi:DUF421 domain-containing protein [Desulfuribacillus alkaliarsenatis]|uniref:YetF C-terminal domain-containing protein n=1 Tax=Desulfuribacillus alkaliarsenatis TaxID=766136 RepID=A0A1E5G0S9_9FIRM|nr:DUF421 domain-containing protein [Desulfuribacillus alkaliarsenatis]OEF96339.1 hypothetical protein BHF68_09320 [Desulfuribacillus alkaliarsenatis]
MEDLFVSVYRTFFIYFFILIIMRVMGKREVAKLSIFDLVVFIMIAELAAVGIEDTDKQLLGIIIPITMVMLLQMLLSYISMKKENVRNLIDGEPSLIIQNGKINDAEMKKQRYDVNDLIMQLHEKQIKNVAEVEYAILEPSGKLTVFPKETSSGSGQNEQVRVIRSKQDDMLNMEIGDMMSLLKDSNTIKTEVRFKGLPLILVSDCKVKEENLQRINQNRFWLKNKLQEAGFKEIKDVYFASIDENGNLFVDGKDY